MPKSKLLLAAAFTLVSGAACAGEPSALVKCDGYARRVSVGEGLARLPLIIGTMGLAGAPETDRPGARLDGQPGIDACTAALADSHLTGNPVRHAEILLARGVLELGEAKPDAAIADANAGLQTPLAPELQPQFDRSLGQALLLLRGLAHGASGKTAEAEADAVAAAQARPYGLLTLNLAAGILAQSPSISPDEQLLLDRYARLSVRGVATRANAGEAAGRFADAARDWQTFVDVAPTGQADPTVIARIGVNNALAGQMVEARAALDRARQRADEIAPSATGTDLKSQQAGQQVTHADELIALGKIELARAAGRKDEARALIAGHARWLSPSAITAPVLTRARAAYGADVVPIDPDKLVVDAAKARAEAQWGKTAAMAMMAVLPLYENPDHARSIGRAFVESPDKLSKVVPSPNGRGLRVVGAGRLGGFAPYNTASEAMLLAMARAAKGAGATRFVSAGEVLIASGAREGAWVTGWAGDLIPQHGDGAPVFVAQSFRALDVAEIEAAIGPMFPKPAPDSPGVRQHQ